MPYIDNKVKKIIFFFLRIEMAHHSQKLEFPSHKDFVPSLIESDPVDLEKILKFCQCTFTILLLSPFGKGRDPLFEQMWIAFT